MLRASLLAALLVALAAPARAQDMVVYDDALGAGWGDWSWSALHDMSNAAPVHAGSASIAVDAGPWEAVYLAHSGTLDAASWQALDFWIHGGTAGAQALRVSFVLAGSAAGSVPLASYVPGGSVPAGTWTHVTIPLADAGVTGGFDGLWFQDDAGATQPRFYLDDITLLDSGVVPPPVTVTVAPDLDRRPISPLVYGVNFGSPGSDLAYPLRRWGGNSTTRYSWQDDVSNRASDWFFMNIESPDPGTLPSGSSSDVFIDASRAAGADVLLTVPTIGWTPRDRVRRWGFSVAKYGPQQQTECDATGGAPWCNPDAGNGLDPGGTPITGNDPADTSRPVDPTFVTGWMAHLQSRLGSAGAGGVRLYALDNEPMLWSSTHRDVHPQALGYDELWQRTLDYASAIKSFDPQAEVMGPSSWGWCDYFWSDADGCGNSAGADYAAHGPLLQWYLASVAAEERASGRRLVDDLEIHYYPQAPGVALSDDESPGVQALRFRSVESLWNPAYSDESWIGSVVRLIPRMHELIDANLPGAKLAITEYSWGNDDGISSALAQAEVLGIFGRERVDMATRWVAPDPGTKVEDAFRAYLDWDGAGSRIDGDSVRATSTDGRRVEAFAIRDASDRVFVVLVNETTGALDVPVTLPGIADGAVPLFGFDETTPYGSVAPVTASAGAFTVSLPPLSLRLAVASIACPPLPAATNLLLSKDRVASEIVFTWQDAPGATGAALHSDLAASGAFATLEATVTGTGAPLRRTIPAGNVHYLVASSNACGEGDLR